MPGCDGAGTAERSYPASKVRGAGERRYPVSEVRGSNERSYPTSEVRGGGREELPHAPKSEAKGGGGKEQRREGATAQPRPRAVVGRTNPTSKEPWLRGRRRP